MLKLTDKVRSIKKQRGLFAVEFAIVGAVFLTAMFMVIEFGRVLYTWNVLDEITRRGARLAAVCPISSGIFGRSTLLSDLEVGELKISYLRANGSAIGSPVAEDPPLGDEIVFVRAEIVAYEYQAVFPINILFEAPAFETTLPAESLGVMPPDTGDTEC